MQLASSWLTSMDALAQQPRRQAIGIVGEASAIGVRAVRRPHPSIQTHSSSSPSGAGLSFPIKPVANGQSLTRDYDLPLWMNWLEARISGQALWTEIWEQTWLSRPYAASPVRPVNDVAGDWCDLLRRCDTWRQQNEDLAPPAGTPIDAENEGTRHRKGQATKGWHEFFSRSTCLEMGV